MSNTSPIPPWLDHLVDLLPPTTIRLVGAGNGSGIWVQWLAAHSQIATTLVEANPQQFAALQRQQALGNLAQATLVNTVIAPSTGDVDFFTASLTSESGLLPSEELRALWPNVHTVATRTQPAMDLAALLQLGAEQSIGPQWLLLDCLPAAALLRSAQAQLPQVDVVVARVLCATDNAPTLCGMGADLKDVADALPGFQLLALQPSRHPALGHALFVRDYRRAAQHASQARDAEAQAKQAAQQVQMELQAKLEAVQAEKSELLKEKEAQTQVRQALQADLAKMTQTRDAEVKAKQAAQQAQMELQAKLEEAQAENSELIKKQQQQAQIMQIVKHEQGNLQMMSEKLQKEKGDLFKKQELQLIGSELKKSKVEDKVKLVKEDIYNKEFFDKQKYLSELSAREVLPELFFFYMPKTLVDVGCGSGAWLKVARDLGVKKVLGVDGTGAVSSLMVSEDDFISCDLSKGLKSLGNFELAISLEVAEHLPIDRADGFIKDLCSLSNVVLFSAAIPYQGGTGHLNENWPEYWADKFDKYNYVPLDLLRDRLWNNDKVRWWYRQNILIFVKKNVVNELFPKVKIASKEVLTRIHPELFVKRANNKNSR